MRLSAPERRAGAGFAAAALAGVACSAAVASGGPILGARWSILARLAVWTAAWGVAAACALRLPRRLALPAVFVVAVLVRLAAVAGPPTLSDDLYRYSWDGRAQTSGTDPYRYTPSSTHLAGLREPWLWPDAAGCARLHRPPGCTRINRPLVHTIYPPVAEAWFTAVYKVAGIGAHHKAWQVAGLLGDLALVGLLPATLRAWKRDERWAVLYALSPLPVVEVVNNGHVDGLAALFVVAALFLAAKRRPGWAGALVGAAALVKLYPILLVVALVAAAVRGGQGWLRRAALPAAAALAVVAAGYLPHVLAVGTRVVGYLPGYLREEHYGGGGRYLLAGLLGLPPAATAALAVAGLAATVAWVLARRPPAPEACVVLVGALLLATTPVQPWYAVSLLAVATVAAAPRWSVLALAGYAYFFAVILDAPHSVAVGRLSYGVALVAVAVSWWRRRAEVPTDSPAHTEPGAPPLASVVGVAVPAAPAATLRRS